MELEQKVGYLQHLLETSHSSQGDGLPPARPDQGLNVGSPTSQSQSLHSEEHVRTYYTFKFRFLMRLSRLFRCGNLPYFHLSINHPLPLQESQSGLLCLPAKHTYLQLGHQRRAALPPHTSLHMNFRPLPAAAPAQAVLFLLL